MKKVFMLSFCTAAYFLNAQSIGNSPYASYGIGDIKYDNTIETSSMGGISTAYISDFSSNFNFANPANNKNFELTSIRLAMSNENNYYKTDYNNMKSTKHSTYLSNISIAFPVTEKLKMGFAYQPYSSKSYEVLNVENYDSGTSKANKFTGSGNINVLQMALGYNINNELAVGLRTNYFFGNLYDLDELIVSDAEYINGYETRNKIANFNFTLGASYQKSLANDRKFTLGATTTFGNTSNMDSFYKNSTYFYNSSGIKMDEFIIDEKSSTGKNLLPLEASIGAGYGEDAKWFLSAQIDYKKGENITYLGKPFSMNDSYRISAGGWYLPNANDFRSYFSRIVYRYGAFYEKEGLELYGNNINRYGISAGVLLPFKNSSTARMSGLEIGVEVGKRGTLNDNLIRQNFINLKFGFNFADKWFRKSYYD